MFNQSVFFNKKIREEEKKGDLVHIFNNSKTFVKYELKLSTEITFYLAIEKNIIIYQIESLIKLHNMIWSSLQKSFLYANSIIYITFGGFKSFDAPFSFYLLLVLLNIAIKEILVLT